MKTHKFLSSGIMALLFGAASSFASSHWSTDCKVDEDKDKAEKHIGHFIGHFDCGSCKDETDCKDAKKDKAEKHIGHFIGHFDCGSCKDETDCKDAKKKDDDKAGHEAKSIFVS